MPSEPPLSWLHIFHVSIGLLSTAKFLPRACGGGVVMLPALIGWPGRSALEGCSYIQVLALRPVSACSCSNLSVDSGDGVFEKKKKEPKLCTMVQAS